MVPKAQGEGPGKPRGRKSRSKTKRAKKPRRQGRAQETKKARERAEGLIDPNLAIVVKDPLRVQILAIAIQRPISPSEFAAELECPLNVASYHFRVLLKHGFLELIELVPVRGSTKHMYRATKSGYISSNDWGQISEVVRPGIAGAALQDFNARVTQALATGTFYRRNDAYLMWAPIVLDENTWPKFVEMMDWAYHEAKELEVETVKLRSNGEGDGCIPVTFAIAGFESPTAKQVKASSSIKKSKRHRRKKKPASDKGKKT